MLTLPAPWRTHSAALLGIPLSGPPPGSTITQPVDSMQLEHQEIQTGTKGQEVAIRVVEHARKQDQVFRVTE